MLYMHAHAHALVACVSLCDHGPQALGPNLDDTSPIWLFQYLTQGRELAEKFYKRRSLIEILRERILEVLGVWTDCCAWSDMLFSHARAFYSRALMHPRAQLLLFLHLFSTYALFNILYQEKVGRLVEQQCSGPFLLYYHTGPKQ